MMASEEDPSDLFAIPDLWRPSTWLHQTFTDSNALGLSPSPLFTIDTPGSSCFGEPHGLINTGQVPISKGAQNNSHAFFKLPSLLQELADDIDEVNLHPKPKDTELRDDLSDSFGSSEEDDLWLAPNHDAAKPAHLRTWEGFNQADQGETSTLFISEAGPAAFDALLASQRGTDDCPDVLDAALYCACLLNLALGRSSVLFSWDAGKNSFVKTAPHLRISGLSLESVGAVDALCLDCGTSARHLQAFAEKTYSAGSTPIRVALARVVDRLVAVVRSELDKRSHDVISVLQLQAAVQPVRAVLLYFKGLVKKLSQQRSDEALLSCLFQEAQASEYRSELLKDCTREVLRILSKPWTDFVEEWVGLKTEEGIRITKRGLGKCFVRVADKMWIDDQGFELEEADYFFDADKLPTFVPEDMGQTMFEAGRNLRFLREHHPEHPLSRLDVVSKAAPPKLEWEFEWEAISKLEARVNQYRNAVFRAIQGSSPTTNSVATSPGARKRKYDAVELDYFGRDGAQVEANLIASIHRLNQPLENHEPEDELTRLLRDHLYRAGGASLGSSSLSPHWSLVPLLSFGPVVDAQSTLISQECMKLLFSAHHLRTHIDLLRQYFLLGNGLLCSRLTHALFDPNLSTAERRAGVALGSGTMGLRLGGRHTWPPASSELRLALMGVLSECYSSPLPAMTPTTSPPRNSTSTTNLPSDLSFAVRDLSPQEIDRCMDPDSLEALDFLRLSYKPPAALRAIMAPTTLLKYDRVFRLLLRVLRMLYVADELFLRASNIPGNRKSSNESNASLRLRIEARHFIKQVAAYFFDVGITVPWKKFEAWLDEVQAECHNPEPPSALSSSSHSPVGDPQQPTTTASTTKAASGTTTGKKTCTPNGVRERQERTLDEIMSVLLLRKRQAPVMGLLEEIFGVLLRFAKGERIGAGGEGETPEELYRLFRKKVEVFVTVCRGLGEKITASSGGSGGPGVGAGGEGNGVEQLLVRLDMAGFYGRRVGG